MKRSPHLRPLNILLVDDGADDCDLLYKAIDEGGINHNLRPIENGEKLMQYLSNCGVDSPDLIFLDSNMPRKEKIACLIEIRANGKFNNTAVAIYSTSSAKEDIEQTFLAGANIYITKPNNLDLLKKIVTELLSTNWLYLTSGMSKENFVMLR